ncbi:MAG: fumarylacetoacetate hydrolase family protein [Fimbriimonadaceae bacterium]
MKLCRFELVSEPGAVRSGLYYSGKVYETDGTQPIGVHELAAVRLLAPLGLAPSVRLFRELPAGIEGWLPTGIESARRRGLTFSYLHPQTVVGPYQVVGPSPMPGKIAVMPCLAVVVSDAGHSIGVEEAPGFVLGLALANVFHHAEIAEDEVRNGMGISRSHDLGIAVGPAITTPEELEEVEAETPFGRTYRLSITLQVNGREVSRYALEDAGATPAELISFASETRPLLPGDLLLLPLDTHGLPVSSEDEIHLVSDRLGTLSSKVG